jgi:hypothetical protein
MNEPTGRNTLVFQLQRQSAIERESISYSLTESQTHHTLIITKTRFLVQMDDASREPAMSWWRTDETQWLVAGKQAMEKIGIKHLEAQMEYHGAFQL